MVVLPFESKICFDNDKYIREEIRALSERAENFHKLYLEFGGKLIMDYHAARVLPGYNTDVKLKVLKGLTKKKSMEFLPVINTRYIENDKPTGSLSLSYTEFAEEMLTDLEKKGFSVNTVVISFFEGQKKAKALAARLRREGYSIYYTYPIKGYPRAFKNILSTRGFGKKPYIKTESDIVVVTAPGPNSGKMATALMAVYQDYLRGEDSGYAKLETFPIWNLPLNSAVNVAYEAATADIGDYNAYDPFYEEAYNKKAVNYNRDIEAFPLLRRLIEKITSPTNYMRAHYLSPTDMGVNRVGFSIKRGKRALCEKAARAEIIRRYFRYKAMFVRRELSDTAYKRVLALMKRLKIKLAERQVVEKARKLNGAALQVNGRVYTAKGPKAYLLALERFVGKPAASLKSLSRELSKEQKSKLLGSELHTLGEIPEEDERLLLKLGVNATWEL